MPRRLLAGMLLALGGCPEPEPEPPPETCADSVATWDGFARPFLTNWCTPCHAAAVEGDERRGAPAGVDFDTWSDASTLAASIRAWAAFDGATMPPAGGPSAEDRVLLAEWVDCGAPGQDQPSTDPCSPQIVSSGDAGAGADLCGAGVNVVAGSLVVAGDAELDCLCAVRGDVQVTGGGASLGNLLDVGGDLIVSGVISGEVALPRLRTVGGAVHVHDNPGLWALDAAVEHAHSVTVRGNGVLRQAHLPRLETLVGALVVADNALLEQANIGGGLLAVQRVVFQANPRLEAIRAFDEVAVVPGDVVLRDLDALVQCDGFFYTGQIGGDLVLEGLALEDVRCFQSLETVGGTLVLRRMTGLTELQGLLGLREAGALVVADNPTLTGIPGLLAVERVEGDLRVVDNPGLSGTAIDLYASGLSVGGTVTVERNAP